MIKFSCSSLGDLMTNPRSKSETLSETCKKRLLQVHIGLKYKRYKEIDSKYFAKGRISEEASIKILSEYMDLELSKNEDRLENDFIKGYPDIITDDLVFEVKTPFDIFTYFNSKSSKLDNSYYWQIQGYLALTGKENAYLAYCLVDTPNFIINQEKKRLSYSMDIVEEEQLYFDKCKQIEKNMKYFDIPISEKIHLFEIERNDEDIKKIYSRVLECREYIKTL